MSKPASSATAAPVLRTAAQRRQRWQLGLCFALVAASVLVVFYYIVFPSRTVFQADCSDTLYWAKASWEAGALFDKDFFYPTLQPFGGWLLMLPFVGAFGLSLTAHILGMVVFAALFMGGLWFFCSALHTGLKRKLLLFSAVLLLLCGSAKLRELMWEHIIYYSLGILFTLLFWGLAFRVMRDVRTEHGGPHRKRLVLWGVLWLLLAVLVGTDGIQVLLFCSVPVGAALVAERFFDAKAPSTPRANLLAGLLAGTLALGSGLGLLLLRVLARGTLPSDYTDLHTAFGPVAAWGENMAKLPGYWATLVGFSGRAGESIASANGAAELLRLLVAVLLAVLPVVAALSYARLVDRQFRIALWTHGFVLGITLLSHVVGTTANAHWRFTPAVFTSVVVSVWYLVLVWQGARWRRVAAALGAVLALVAALNVYTMLRIPRQNGQNQHYITLANTLRHQGLAYGFGDYFVSQMVTVMSNEAVRVRNAHLDERGVHMRGYQTARRWYEDVPGVQRYFVITSRDEYDAWLAESDAWRQLQDAVQQELACDEYLILVFDENPIGFTQRIAQAAGG